MFIKKYTFLDRNMFYFWSRGTGLADEKWKKFEIQMERSLSFKGVSASEYFDDEQLLVPEIYL